MTEELVLDGLTFTVQRSARRKSIGLTVERDGSLMLHAPTDRPIDALETFARANLVWVHTKLTEKQTLSHPTYHREFVNGEGFYYLGHSYRLWLDDDLHSPPLRLYAGRFWLRRDELPNAAEQFIIWYRTHGLAWLYNRALTYTNRLGVEIRNLEVRSLGEQWGTCETDSTIAFHWRVMMLPPSIIDYVIVHELAHLRESHHKAPFWRRIARALPDYAERKRWLDKHGAVYDL